MKGFFSWLVDWSLMMFILFVSLLIVLYLAAFFEKLAEPHYKNLRYEEFGWLGLILLPFIFLGFLALRYFFGKLKKKFASGPQGWR